MNKEMKKEANFKNPNLYGLFGWEAREARPNCDPFTNELRTYGNADEVRVYTTPEHVKYHWRRGIQSVGREIVKPAKSVIFYEKNGDSFEERLAAVRRVFEIPTKEETRNGKKIVKLVEGAKDVWCYCLDIPLLGHTHAETDNHFNMVNAVNFLYRPATFHLCDLLSVATNNFAPQKGKDSAGSHTTTSLQYGFFLGLFELRLPTLADNTRDHELLPSSRGDDWIRLMVDGLWEAYTNERGTSISQRMQKANFLLVWEPQKMMEDIDLMLLNPAEILTPFPKISDPHTARQKLKEELPAYLNELGYTHENLIAAKGLENGDGVFEIPAERRKRPLA
jgi:hypothetical protein